MASVTKIDSEIAKLQKETNTLIKKLIAAEEERLREYKNQIQLVQKQQAKNKKIYYIAIVFLVLIFLRSFFL